MKQIKTVNMPVCWTGDRPEVTADSNFQKKCFEEAVSIGFDVKHITSSTVNNVMYVYFVLEKED